VILVYEFDETSACDHIWLMKIHWWSS